MSVNLQKDLRKKSLKGNSKTAYMPDVANYDLHPDYHYSSYWNNRVYEHKAELYAINALLGQIFKKKLLSPSENIRILDLGAGFGRLFPSYCRLFDEVVLGDYSVKELTDATGYVKKFDCNKNVRFVALNAYFLPFHPYSFDAIISVRLIHHIEQVPAFLKEIERVLAPGGVVILEVANKNNIKALLRALFRLDFSFVKKKRVKISHNPTTAQGLTRGQTRYVFYNYNINYVIKQAQKVGLTLKAIRQVSILRSPLLKKYLPTNLLVLLDRLYQILSGVLNKFRLFLTPSVFLVFQKHSNAKSKKSVDKQVDFVRILSCPKHSIALNYKTLTCGKGCKFSRVGKILDLRFPVITV